MTDLAFEFDDAHEFAAVLATAPTIVESEMLNSTNRIVLQGEAWAKERLTANGSVVTGQGRRSITATPAVFAGGTFTARFGTATPYLKLVENGRGAIRAKGKALAFKPKGSSEVIFRKSVGPAKARPFMRPTVDRLRPLVPKEYGAALQRVVNKIRMATG